MSSIVEALQGLRVQQESLSRSYLAFPVDISRECRHLKEVAHELSERAGNVRLQKSAVNLLEVWRFWAARQYNLSELDARQIKALCNSPDSATTPEFLDALNRDDTPLRRAGCLIGLILCYFAKWGNIPYQDKMETLIKRSLDNYRRRNPVVNLYRHHATKLFSKQTAEFLAETALDDRESPKGVLSKFHIGLSGNLTTAAFSAAVRQFLSRSNRVHGSAEAEAFLVYALTHLLGPELSSKDFYKTVAELILHEWPDKHIGCQNKIREYVLRHASLGDPRLKAANWAGMSKPAADRFLSWIAKENITFFFNHILPDNSQNRRRKDFWLRYASCVRDFQVALSYEHYRQLVASARLRDVPGFARLDHSDTSAFLMRFRGPGNQDIVIVEFSENGNAAHMFAASAFEVQAGDFRQSRFEFVQLKHRADQDRILHRGDKWEYRAFQRLAEWGIRP